MRPHAHHTGGLIKGGVQRGVRTRSLVDASLAPERGGRVPRISESPPLIKNFEHLVEWITRITLYAGSPDGIFSRGVCVFTFSRSYSLINRGILELHPFRGGCADRPYDFDIVHFGSADPGGCVVK